MRSLFAVWCAVLACACGRLHFDREQSDAGATGDGRVGDGAVAACPPFATFCDGFESGDLGKWTFTSINGSNPTAQVATTTVHTGAFALAADVPPGGQDHAASPVLTIPVQSTEMLAVREWINASDPIQYFNVVLVLQNDQTGQFATVGGDDAGHWVSSDNTAGNVLTDHRSTVATAPADTWTCVEMVFTFPKAPDPARVQVFVNGTTVLETNVNDPSPAYNGIGVGIPRADNGGFHLFTDDVVVAHQRIGCS